MRDNEEVMFDDANEQKGETWEERRSRLEEQSTPWMHYGESCRVKREDVPFSVTEGAQRRAALAASTFEGNLYGIVKDMFGLMGVRAISSDIWAEIYENVRLLSLSSFYEGQREQWIKASDESYRRTKLMLGVALTSAIKGESTDAAAIRMMAAGQGVAIPQEDVDAMISRVERTGVR